ncbi:hypothetical protein F5X96DRAFT_642203 [Biscogniauxia mediterranea]|nr:hypothetical protein F5X96DRAFT_642203 [Biscogniauxia mediterranea]
MKPLELLFPLLISIGIGVHASPLSSLKATLGRRLRVATPLALPCFTSNEGRPNGINESTCTLVREEWETNNLRVLTPGSFMNLQSGMCLSDPEDQCLVDNTVSPAGMPSENSTCNQGSAPSYYIQVTCAEDVAAVFKFTEEHEIRLTIKNSG